MACSWPQLSCSSSKKKVGASCNSTLSVQSFSESFDQPLSDNNWGLEVADVSRFEQITSPTRLGSGAVKLTVKPGDVAASGERAELKHFNNDPLCSEGWYAWSFMLPSDYPDINSADPFQIIGQWHDRPDEAAGETFQTYHAQSPLIALHYRGDNSNPRVFARYGLKDIKRIDTAERQITKGEWHDVIFHIKWSVGSDGFAEVWIDSIPLLHETASQLNGPNMSNAIPAYLKLGLYRKQDAFSADNNVLIDEVRIANTHDEVVITTSP